MVVRLGAMGDVLHALPAVSALRRAQPYWIIDWAIEPHWRPLLAADSAASEAAHTRLQPVVNQIHLVPAKEWSRAPVSLATLRSMLQTRASLRADHYDVILDLQGAVRSAVIANWAMPRGARLIGEAAPREPAARFLFKERIESSSAHVIDQAADVVRAITGTLPPVGPPDLPCDPEAALWCDQAGAGANLGPAILLHPGAGWGAKRWPVERYAIAGAEIAKITGYQVMINSAPGELELGAALASQLRALRVSPLLLSPSVGQLIELTRRATLAVGGDTGPLHLAAALGKATVGIYGPTDPARNGPYHGHFSVLRDPASLRNHARHRDPEPGLMRISPDRVAEAAVTLLREQAAAERGKAAL